MTPSQNQNNQLPTTFNNQEGTLALASEWNRMEGFVSGFAPHSTGNGGTLFLSVTRTKQNSQKKTSHTAAISVFGNDAVFAKAVAEFLKTNDTWVYFSVETRWQSHKVGTGEMVQGRNGQVEKTRDVLSFEGRNIIEVNPYQNGENARQIRNSSEAYVNSSQVNNQLPTFNNQEGTLSTVPEWNRMEGFVSGFAPHSTGNGGTLFLSVTRTKQNSQKKTSHTAAISVFGRDAVFAKAVADFLKNNDTWVYFSVEARWQSHKVGTGEMVQGRNGQVEKTRDVLSFEGRNIIEVNPYQNGENARQIRNSSEAYVASLQQPQG